MKNFFLFSFHSFHKFMTTNSQAIQWHFPFYSYIEFLLLSYSPIPTVVVVFLCWWNWEKRKREKNFGSVIKNIKKVIFCTDVSNPYNNFLSSFPPYHHFYTYKSYINPIQRKKRSCGWCVLKKGWSFISYNTYILFF